MERSGGAQREHDGAEHSQVIIQVTRLSYGARLERHLQAARSVHRQRERDSVDEWGGKAVDVSEEEKMVCA